MLLQLLLALAMQAKPASIRGKVTVADTGTAIRWAVVKVQAGPANASYSATTDSNGVYEVHNLPPGNYTARAGKPGFIEKSYLKGDVSTVTLAAGQAQEGVDIQLPRSAVITGTIIDMEGDPVAGAIVQAVTKAYPQGRVAWRPMNSVETNDHGEYRLYGLAAGRYYLHASRTLRGMGVSAAYASVIFPSVSRFEDARSVIVSPGEEHKGVNMTLRESPTYVVSGKVLGTSNASGPGMNGFINLNTANFGAGSQGFSQVNADGSFRIQGIAPGFYTLRGSFPMGFGGGNAQQPFTRFVEVTNGNVELTIDAAAGGTVKGRVKAEGGELPANLNVSLGMKNPANGQINGGGSGAQADAEGNFEFKHVQPGLYDLNVNQTTPSRREFFVGSMKVGDTDILTTGLVVSEGTPTIDASITMDFRPGEVIGKTLDADSNPLPNATIALFSADPKRRSPRTWRSLKSKADSTFRLFNLPPGDYYLVIWPNDDVGLALDDEVFGMLEPQIAKVKIELGGKVTQDVTLTKALRTIADTFSQ